MPSTGEAVRQTAIVGPPHVSVRLQGASSELRGAVRAGLARCVLLLPLTTRGLPQGWAVPIDPDEVVVATTPIVVEAVKAVGIGALVVKRSALVAVHLDDEARERIACALALMAGLGG